MDTSSNWTSGVTQMLTERNNGIYLNENSTLFNYTNFTTPKGM